jgi:hypothetical protein
LDGRAAALAKPLPVKEEKTGRLAGLLASKASLGSGTGDLLKKAHT